jgi:hypothetical protein
MRPVRARTLILAAAAALILVVLQAPGSAVAGSCTTTTAVNGSNWNYTRCQIPDVDQVREEDAINQVWGLPNNGLMYCVPTAAANFMAYLANQGFPSVSPGPGYWGPESFWPPQPQYTKMTNALKTMGALMGTDPYGGTGGAAAMWGIAIWLGGSGQGWNFVVSDYNASGFYAPQFTDLAADALAGALVMAGVGWYKPGGDGFSFGRNGGHMFSLSQALISGNAETIGFRDPAFSNDDPYEQSTFATVKAPVLPTLGLFDGSPRVEDRLQGYGSSTFLDNYLTITPKFVLVSDQAKLYFLTPIKLVGDDSPAKPDFVSFPSGDGRAIADLAISPEGTKHVYLTEGSDTIWQVDSLTGRSAAFATVNGPRKLVFGGREQKLFVVTADQLITLGRDGRQVDATPLKDPLAAIAFDERADRLVGLTERRDRLVLYDENLVPRGSVALPQLGCRGGLTMKVDPATGEIVVHCDGATTLTRLTIADDGSAVRARQVLLQGAAAPGGLTVDDQGHTFVSDGGRLADYDPDGRLVESSPFAGLPGGANVDVLRSFSNFDPKTMSDARFRNVLPEDAWRN